jgi:hypothetical protein
MYEYPAKLLLTVNGSVVIKIGNEKKIKANILEQRDDERSPRRENKLATTFLLAPNICSQWKIHDVMGKK